MLSAFSFFLFSFDTLSSEAGYALILVASIFILTQISENVSFRELIHECRQKSQDWDTIWQKFEERYGHRIALFIYKEFHKLGGKKWSTQVEETVKDLRQDVYIKLLMNKASALSNFRGIDEHAFLAYLNAIAMNVVRNHVKSIKTEKRGAGSFVTRVGEDKRQMESEPLTANTPEELEELFFKESIINTLKESYRSRNLDRDIFIFKLFYFEGHTAVDIHAAHNFNLTVGGIETVVSRMKQLLKKIYRV